jgi:hypothetical protein
VRRSSFGGHVVREGINSRPALIKNGEVILRDTLAREGFLEGEDGAIDRFFGQLERFEVDGHALCALDGLGQDSCAPAP